MVLLFPMITLKSLLPLLAIVAAVFVITTKNAIISVFNLVVLYILVAFYLIYIGIAYLGISYIIIYIGAIAILFLFIIMMIDIEVVEKRSNNYLPLLFLLLSGFLLILNKILFSIGLLRMKSLIFREKLIFYKSKRSIESEKSNPREIEISGPNNNVNYERLNWMRNGNSEITNLKNKDYMNRENNIEINSVTYLEKKKGEESYSYGLNIGNKYNKDKNYLFIAPDWDSATNRITQISAIGDVLYTLYHSYIYILSVILLLGMVGAIILTADSSRDMRIISISRHKENNILSPYYIIKMGYWLILNLKTVKSRFDNIRYNIYNDINNVKEFIITNIIYVLNSNIYQNKINSKYIYCSLYVKERIINKDKRYKSDKLGNNLLSNIISNKKIAVSPFSQLLNTDSIYSEGIIGNLLYFIIANIVIALLFLAINSYFSVSIKYLEKGGGFECGFTSFVQTRERFNIIFYRVSLLFLVFDLEIILVFPYTATYQKNQNMSKNNVLIFLYILIVGFIYELKEGALNIVKKAHSTEINVQN